MFVEVFGYTGSQHTKIDHWLRSRSIPGYSLIAAPLFLTAILPDKNFITFSIPIANPI
jgi:hypothetical protein